MDFLLFLLSAYIQRVYVLNCFLFFLWIKNVNKKWGEKRIVRVHHPIFLLLCIFFVARFVWPLVCLTVCLSICLQVDFCPSVQWPLTLSVSVRKTTYNIWKYIHTYIIMFSFCCGVVAVAVCFEFRLIPCHTINRLLLLGPSRLWLCAALLFYCFS